ncbi:sialate O-acetylesterase [Urechidicola vernalis]|uniref:Sialate O-acetylesterase n=1 Tax=Urechidicola vernalis TaxID=3075600 RepID=A0ABU2Y757_9FLAO|nr:sialate O-acetylesterase [Urechidicola sp. P050]MDT0553060.1 sialate O-acetylesterase [Urechidicola sp. P050]
MKINPVNRTFRAGFKTCILLFIFAFNFKSYAEIYLPSIISDNMVLQQNSEATIWGWTTVVSENITVIGSWNNEEVMVEAHQGKWSLNLPTEVAGGPYTLTIKGHETITIYNVLLGEVWLCSGQSNMQWTPNMGLQNAEEEIKNANHEQIRFFTIPTVKAESAQDNSYGNWDTCTPETMQNFSSVAYFFGRELKTELNVPVGLINSSWGGTNVETWIPKEILKTQKKEISEAYNNIGEFAWWPRNPGLTYNSMIHPITNYDIAGAIWYQGESNRDNAFSYFETFPLMIETWRAKWNKDFPFYFVQIAPFNYNSHNNLATAVVQEAQLFTMQTVPKTGMVVTNDIGNLKNIHPLKKQEVGQRLALWALAKTYGVKDVTVSGPVYKSMQIEKNKIRLSFDFAENGLIQKGAELTEFLIAGADQKFHKATATIKGNKIEVFSKKVKKPVAVRFAYSAIALPNLFNKEGLPASGFRTDIWPINFKTE